MSCDMEGFLLGIVEREKHDTENVKYVSVFVIRKATPIHISLRVCV